MCRNSHTERETLAHETNRAARKYGTDSDKYRMGDPPALGEPLLKKDLACCRHTLPEAFGIRSNLDRKLGRVIGTVVNGERQIEIAGRGAGVVEDARAD
jgi:hypothetical protein